MTDKHKLAWVKPTVRKLEVTEQILALFPEEIAAHFVTAAPRAVLRAKVGGR